MSKRYAVISVGTNSTRLLLADVAPEVPRVEVARSIGTRIGEGLDETKSLAEEPMRRTIEAMTQLQRTVRGHYLRIFGIATSAVRRAENAGAFLERVGAVLGIPMRVLTGEEEAEASYRGATTVFGRFRGERVGVVDTGGGSTEYAWGTTATPERVLSCEIGAVRLTERLAQLAGHDGPVDPATIEQGRTMARDALAPLKDAPAVEQVALVGGSATTAAAIVRGRAGAITSYRLTRAQLNDVALRLCAMPLDERKTVAGMRAQRADILPAGILVLDAALEIVGLDAATATTSDLLLGYMLQQRDAAGGSAGQGPPLRAGTETRRGPY